MQQARAARHQVEIAREQTELQQSIHKDSLQPLVYADIRVDKLSRLLLDLVVENTGPTVATNVRIEFDPPLRSTLATGPDDQETPGIATTLSSLPPGRRMSWNIDHAFGIFGDKGADFPKQYKVRITGDGPFGPLDPLEYVLNYEDYLNTEARNAGSLIELTQSVDKVAKAIEARSGRRGQSRSRLSTESPDCRQPLTFQAP